MVLQALQSSTQKVPWVEVKQTGGRACEIDNNVFRETIQLLCLTVLFLVSLSPCFVSKKHPFTGLQLQVVNYLWQLLIWLFKLGQSNVQHHQDNMTSVLTLYFPLEYSQSDNGAVCRSVACPTALYKLTTRLPWVLVSTMSMFFLLLQNHLVQNEI